jgi:hypothetical protein
MDLITQTARKNRYPSAVEMREYTLAVVLSRCTVVRSAKRRESRTKGQRQIDDTEARKISVEITDPSIDSLYIKQFPFSPGSSLNWINPPKPIPLV